MKKRRSTRSNGGRSLSFGELAKFKRGPAGDPRVARHAMREARDAKLAAPLLLLPSIQVNIRAGKLPPAESNDVHYLKIPVQLVS